MEESLKSLSPASSELSCLLSQPLVPEAHTILINLCLHRGGASTAYNCSSWDNHKWPGPLLELRDNKKVLRENYLVGNKDTQVNVIRNAFSETFEIVVCALGQVMD